ncbi:unnamed protein product, partial [Ectocarpus sp. 8 AP-2014]
SRRSVLSCTQTGPIFFSTRRCACCKISLSLSLSLSPLPSCPFQFRCNVTTAGQEPATEARSGFTREVRRPPTADSGRFGDFSRVHTYTPSNNVKVYFIAY